MISYMFNENKNTILGNPPPEAQACARQTQKCLYSNWKTICFESSNTKMPISLKENYTFCDARHQNVNIHIGKQHVLRCTTPTCQYSYRKTIRFEIPNTNMSIFL